MTPVGEKTNSRVGRVQLRTNCVNQPPSGCPAPTGSFSKKSINCIVRRQVGVRTEIEGGTMTIHGKHPRHASCIIIIAWDHYGIIRAWKWRLGPRREVGPSDPPLPIVYLVNHDDCVGSPADDHRNLLTEPASNGELTHSSRPSCNSKSSQYPLIHPLVVLLGLASRDGVTREGKSGTLSRIPTTRCSRL